MARDSRYDILFEPVQSARSGRPTASTRCRMPRGMTNALPRVRAAFRDTKAEGGWGVVCTGACSIHPSSDDAPLPLRRCGTRTTSAAHALMTEAVHRHGSLAGVELWHGGASVDEPHQPPAAAVAIRHSLDGHACRLHGQSAPARRWTRATSATCCAGRREGAREARGGGLRHRLCLCRHGLSRLRVPAAEYNQRTDEYGGSIANRVRLRARDDRGHARRRSASDCGVALRISLEELRGRPGTHAESEAHEVIELLIEDAPISST